MQNEFSCLVGLNFFFLCDGGTFSIYLIHYTRLITTVPSFVASLLLLLHSSTLLSNVIVNVNRSLTQPFSTTPPLGCRLCPEIMLLS